MTKLESPSSRTAVVLALLLVAAVGTVAVAPVAEAIPVLQLDVLGGVYDQATQTIVAQDSRFTLFAYIIPDGHTGTGGSLQDTFYLSMGLVPQTSPPGANLGSFTFNGSTIAVTSDMTYGTPPIEANLAHDDYDLGAHGIYATYFTEVAFSFNAANTTNQYDTALTTGVGPTPFSGGEPPMYFARFDIDTGGLAGGHAIHFDLYAEIFRNGDIDTGKFAPFDHDAQSPRQPVPEIYTLLIVGTGLVLAGMMSGRHRGR